MDVLTPFFRARFISNLITFFIIWNYAESQLKKYYAQEHQLDEKQVVDNIKNNRRRRSGYREEDKKIIGDILGTLQTQSSAKKSQKEISC